MNSDVTCQTCRYALIYNGYGVCERFTVIKKRIECKDKAHLVLSAGGSDGDNPFFVVAADFGCNQHEPKETETAKENH